MLKELTKSAVEFFATETVYIEPVYVQDWDESGEPVVINPDRIEERPKFAINGKIFTINDSALLTQSGLSVINDGLLAIKCSIQLPKLTELKQLSSGDEKEHFLKFLTTATLPDNYKIIINDGFYLGKWKPLNDGNVISGSYSKIFAIKL